MWASWRMQAWVLPETLQSKDRRLSQENRKVYKRYAQERAGPSFDSVSDIDLVFRSCDFDAVDACSPLARWWSETVLRRTKQMIRTDEHDVRWSRSRILVLPDS